MEDNSNRNKDNNTAKEVVNKVAGGEQASLSDEPLTPSRKIEAETKRMQQAASQPEVRHESDHQVANLGGTILTPEKKMDLARQQAQPAFKKKNKA